MSLQVHQLACTRAGWQLVNDLNFELHPGAAVWLTGSNGSGKTSVLRLLCGLASPSAGEVRWNGKPIQQQREQYFSSLSYCGHASGIKDDLTALENVLLSTRIAGKKCSVDDALAALRSLNLEPQAHLPVRSLSMGQRKRVALSRLLIAPAPQLLILDEAFSALDQDAIQNLCSVLLGYLAQGGMLIYTTHQPVSQLAALSMIVNLGSNTLC